MEAVCEEIRRSFLGAGPPPPGPDPEKAQNDAVNRDGRTIVLLVYAPKDNGGTPDPGLVRTLLGLFDVYEKLMLVFDVGTDRQPLPAPLQSAQPRLNDPEALKTFLASEYDACLDERTTKTFLDQKYGTGP